MSNNSGFALAILLLMAATGLGFQLSKEKGWYGRQAALAFKGLATFAAVLLALYAYSRSGQAFALALAAGLLLCAAADVALELRFTFGMALFGLGHMAYIVSFVLRDPPGLPSLFVFLTLALSLAFAAYFLRARVPFIILPYFAYALVIGAMLSLSLAQPPLSIIGAAFFVVSDAMIAFRLIRPEAPSFDRTCITLYYAGQYLLALSALF